MSMYVILGKAARKGYKIIESFDWPQTCRKHNCEVYIYSMWQSVVRWETISVTQNISRNGKDNRRFGSETYQITMSLCWVRIEFHCENTFITLTYIHDLPRTLVPVDSTVFPRGSEYAVLLERAVFPILKERACQAASNPQCGVCSSATKQILQIPISIVQDVKKRDQLARGIKRRVWQWERSKVSRTDCAGEEPLHSFLASGHYRFCIKSEKSERMETMDGNTWG